MLKFYKDNDRGKKIPYVTMQSVNEDVVITIYDKNKKGEKVKILINSGCW